MRMLLGHMVYFTLKDNSPAAVERMLTACRTYLTGHEGTVFFAAGTVVPDLTREVNQRDYHVALQMVFENREAHDRYQVHERHQRFIAENRDNWTRVRVFDANISC
jgi:hypothetical protein